MTEAIAETLSLDQMLVLLAVANEGSFSAAARKLRRAQSAVSYAIANLERLLDLTLFDRSTRTPTLTPAGEEIVREVSAVVERVEKLHARARSMARGVEPRLAVAIDVMFPQDALVNAIGAFRMEFPEVSLVVHTEALGGVAKLVRDRVCQLGVSTYLPEYPRELEQRTLASIPMCAVVGKHHPLSTAKHALSNTELRQHVQLVLSDRSELTAGRDFGVVSTRTWRLGDLGTKLAFLRAGFGWGGMPLHMVEEDLARGSLVRLKVQRWDPGTDGLPLAVVYRADSPPGPAGLWLLDRIESEKACPRLVRKS